MGATSCLVDAASMVWVVLVIEHKILETALSRENDCHKVVVIVLLVPEIPIASSRRKELLTTLVTVGNEVVSTRPIGCSSEGHGDGVQIVVVGLSPSEGATAMFEMLEGSNEVCFVK